MNAAIVTSPNPLTRRSALATLAMPVRDLVVHDPSQSQELRQLLGFDLVARARQLVGYVRTDGCRTALEHQDAIAEVYGFVDVVGDEDDRRLCPRLDPLQLVLQRRLGH